MEGGDVVLSLACLGALAYPRTWGGVSPVKATCPEWEKIGVLVT